MMGDRKKSPLPSLSCGQGGGPSAVTDGLHAVVGVRGGKEEEKPMFSLTQLLRIFTLAAAGAGAGKRILALVGVHGGSSRILLAVSDSVLAGPSSPVRLRTPWDPTLYISWF